MSRVFRTVVGRHGSFVVPENDRWAGAAMWTYGEFQEHRVELLSQLVTQSSRVVWVGAGYGLELVPIARKAGEIVAFEPQRWVHQLLCANVVLNDLLNVRTRQLALSCAIVDRFSVPVLDPARPNSFTAFSMAGMSGKGPGDAVGCSILDAQPDVECAMLVVDVPDLVENVLDGGRELVARVRPAILCPTTAVTRRRLIDLFTQRMNYRVVEASTASFNPDNFLRAGPSDSAPLDRTTGDLLAVPREAKVVLNNFKELV